MEQNGILRQEMKKRRSALSDAQQKAYSEKICASLADYIMAVGCDMAYVYFPLGSEVDLVPLIRRLWEESVKTAFPKVDGEDLAWYEVDRFSMLGEGCFHVMEPKPEVCRKVDYSELLRGQEARVVVIVPGVVFDKSGNRIGYGRGFYDRFLAEMLGSQGIRERAEAAAHQGFPVMIGAAYECQMVSCLETKEWDIRMDAVVTQEHWYPQKLSE